MCQVKANTNFHGHELSDIAVINPGGWFGKTWLIEIGGSYSSFYLVVEAGSMSDAIDELADDEKHSHHIVVEEENLGDYDSESCHYGPSGQVLDLDHIMIYGQEGSATPFPCKYTGGCIDGVCPTEFECECE
ncbi:hypothetical protein [Fuerstiella marisgermanici]|uniref:Uncharacterized protein n=1 Tax=Fuerstiella marisgermanici TaxID=1891926 RepID=A0A1P8WH14_9PLAN|nr:hypothetical protein [Fuerstiella marisgermanici]APZ93342.1 hypothetical protein Fuma_02959 [Fuerstiella marisgermanici]